MHNPIAPHSSTFSIVATVVALLVLSPVSANGGAKPAQQSREGRLILAQNATATAAPAVAIPPNAKAPAAVFWTFGSPSALNEDSWTAERGKLTLGEGRLQPDNQGRVVLLSPADLPTAIRGADEFFLGVTGTGLQRVRVQARRDARGGWITIADASGATLHHGSDGYTIRRSPGARDAPIERLRIELQFRTTNPRDLQRIGAIPNPP